MRITPILISLILLCFPLQAQQGAGDIHPYFSPNGGCTEAVVKALDRSQKSVLVQAYSFTSAPIAKALVDAKKRGVDVQVILDKSQKSERYSSATFLANEGVPTFIDADHRIAHNKVMLIDGDELITGSFNFTKSAEEGNAENLLIITHAPELAEIYTSNWKEHLKHSQAYEAKLPPLPGVGVSSSVSTAPPSPSTAQESPQDQGTGYWMSSTGKRHNSHCRYYKNCKGHECGAEDGVACKICGG